MDKTILWNQWLEEERIAHIHGWDFSHLDGRYEEEGDLPWDYRDTVMRYLRPDSRLLDLDTGGGEFLLSLGHSHALTAATEVYPPNVALCRETLSPLGIDFREANAAGPLPFEDGSFDLVINRHGDYSPAEIARVLKAGGVFVTQQVGAENDRELVEQLLPHPPAPPFPRQYLSIARADCEAAGLTVLEGQEAFRPIRFYDVGALVWFAHIIEWEFPGFTVESSRKQLYRLQEQLEERGMVEGRIHRFLLAARKERS